MCSRKRRVFGIDPMGSGTKGDELTFYLGKLFAGAALTRGYSELAAECFLVDAPKGALLPIDGGRAGCDVLLDFRLSSSTVRLTVASWPSTATAIMTTSPEAGLAVDLLRVGRYSHNSLGNGSVCGFENNYLLRRR